MNITGKLFGMKMSACTRPHSKWMADFCFGFLDLAAVCIPVHLPTSIYFYMHDVCVVVRTSLATYKIFSHFIFDMRCRLLLLGQWNLLLIWNRAYIVCLLNMSVYCIWFRFVFFFFLGNVVCMYRAFCPLNMIYFYLRLYYFVVSACDIKKIFYLNANRLQILYF